MTTSHLTDREIQQYLDGQLTGADEKIDHLATCNHCQVQLSLFRTIYQASSDIPIVMDPMLADSVMNRIIIPTEKKVYLKTGPFVLAGLTACFIIIILLLRVSDVILSGNFWSLFSFRHNGELLTLVSLAGILLVGFQWLDGKMLKRSYTRKNLI